MDEKNPLKVLIVDNDQVEQERIASFVEPGQVKVQSVGSGKDALKLLDTQAVEVVLVSVFLPDTNGIALVKEIKRANGLLDCIVLSGKRRADAVIQAMRNEASDFLAKPVTRRTLGAALKRAAKRIEAFRQLADREANLFDQVEEQLRIIAHDNKNSILFARQSLEILSRQMAEGRLADLEERHREEIERHVSEAMNTLDLGVSKVRQLMDGGLRKEIRARKLNQTDEFDLVHTIEECCEDFEIFSAVKKIKLEKELTVDAFPFFGLERSMYHVINNLMHNAVKYSPEGSRVGISFTVEEGGADGLRHINISVTDCGTGIPPDQIPLIFEKGYRGNQTDLDGTGFGLHYVQQVVQEHGGQVEVESRVGKGTTMTIDLPVF